MTKVLLRNFDNKDLEDVQHLIYQLTGKEITTSHLKERFQYFNNKDFEFLYIAELEGRTAGLLGFRIRENVEDETRYGEVSMLVVDESFRRQGIASSIMEYAEELAKEKGCIGLWLVSGFGREEHAHGFYKNYGFEITGYRFVKKFN